MRVGTWGECGGREKKKVKGKWKGRESSEAAKIELIWQPALIFRVIDNLSQWYHKVVTQIYQENEGIRDRAKKSFKV